jgi:HEAT repeat protein
VGFLDFISGGTPAEKAQKLKAKVTQKFGDAANRQKAISTLGDMDIPEATAVLLYRFTINVDPHTTDHDEKEHTFDLICARGEAAVVPTKEFLKKSDAASSWALKILGAIMTEEQVISVAIENLERLGAEYTRDPEKKQVLLGFLQGKADPRIGPVALPFLEDMADDIKLAALATLSSVKFEGAREPVLKLLTGDETGKRVQTACIALLHDCGFNVQGFREKVEERLSEPYHLDKSGLVKKRG